MSSLSAWYPFQGRMFLAEDSVKSPRARTFLPCSVLPAIELWSAPLALILSPSIRKTYVDKVYSYKIILKREMACK